MITREPADPYLGREDLLDRLSEMLTEVATGHGRLVTLRGPAGIGTTATARQVARRAADDGFEVVWGGCREGIAGRPFEALAEALDDYARRAGPAALYEELGDGAPALARLASQVRVALPAIPPPAPLDAHGERLRIADAVLHWLRRAAAERPVLAVLDDLQWGDEDLRLALDHLSEHLESMAVLVLATWADYPADAGAAPDLPASAIAVVLEVAGLDEGATGALLSRTADRPITSAALHLIQQASRGHPLAALELYRHLRSEEMIGRPGGDHLPTADELPQSFEELVVWRMARLSLDERTAIGALACFPAPASAAQVSDVSGLSRTRVAEALEKCVAHGFVRSPEMSARYQLIHPRLERAIRDGLSATVRAEAWARVAESLELELGAEARQQAPLLADLYRRSLGTARGAAGGGKVGRAAAGVRHAIVAAEQARSAAAFRRAAEFLSLAAEFGAAGGGGLGQREHQLRVALARAEADQPVQALAIASSLLRGITPTEAEGVIAAIRALLDHGRATEAETLRSGLARALREPTQLITARLELLAGRWQLVETGAVRVQFWIVDEDLAELVLAKEGDEQDLSELFAAPRARNRDQTVRLLNAARDWRRPSTLLRALRGASVDLATRLGAFREAQSWAGEYFAAAERFGSARDLVRAALLLAQSEAQLGDFASADESLAAAAEAIARLPPAERPVREQLAAELALAHYRDGDWPGLLARIDEVTSEPTPHGLLLAAEGTFAAARAGDLGRAGGSLGDVLEVVAHWPPLTYLRDSALLTGLTVAWECGWAQYTVRGRSLATLAAAAGAGGNHAATPELSIARLHALTGQLAEARALFAEQRSVLQEAGMRPLRAIVDYDEAIALAAGGPAAYPAAAALLETAAVAFDGLGMVGWHGRARSLLDGGFESAAGPGGRLHFTYPFGLSRREADVVRLVSAGLSVHDAAAELEVEREVADRHLASAMTKLGASDPADLPRLARRHGLGGGV
ncbi:hypothetical protein BH23CHL7_BH23CHL7_22920 [soil metagenome]